MKILPEQTKYIKKAFPSMKTKEDFLSLLNFAKNIIYGKQAYPFELRQLNFYINSRTNKLRYYIFSINKKKVGEMRIIHAPVMGLKAIQVCLNLILQEIYEPGPTVTGFVPGKSVLDNASIHIGQNYVFNVDLKDFFPSIEQGRIWGRMKLSPFFLNEKKGNLEIANMISILCSHKMEVERLNQDDVWTKVVRNVLPQGAPTSPVLSNIICQQLDFYLSAVAKRFGLKYSRYADDITFSSMHNIYHRNGDFFNELNKIITKQGFAFNISKTRLQKTGFRQEVTGLVVNTTVNLPKRYIKQLRVWLKNWEQLGYDQTSKIFFSSGEQSRSYSKSGLREMSKIIGGKLNYFMMIKGKENPTYLKLKSRFDSLNNTMITSELKAIPRNFSSEHSDQTLKISLELSEGGQTSGILKRTINIAKDTIVPGIIIVNNAFKGNVETLIKQYVHDPFYTVSFLKQFKIGDGSGFKELVHDTELTSESFEKILKIVKSHQNFIFHYHRQYVTGVSFLNSGIQQEVIKLIDLFSGKGKDYFSVSGKHPYNNNLAYTKFAAAFKKKYRFGSGSEYSKLRTDICTILQSRNIYNYKIIFMPDDRIFDIRASFFTWQPSIYQGIKYLISGIADHSNENGNMDFFVGDKEIIIGAERLKSHENSFVQITITDVKSISMTESNTLLHYLEESPPFKTHFRYLCDWIVECDFTDEVSKRFNLLSVDLIKPDFQRIEIISEKVGGFKHILRFYDNV